MIRLSGDVVSFEYLARGPRGINANKIGYSGFHRITLAWGRRTVGRARVHPDLLNRVITAVCDIDEERFIKDETPEKFHYLGIALQTPLWDEIDFEMPIRIVEITMLDHPQYPEQRPWILLHR